MLSADTAGEVLRHGRIEVRGRLVEASNATLFCSIVYQGLEADCVYKPVRGERPLWDFPDGTLAGREVAAFLLSEATGWGVVPPTVSRDGPFGTGMVQLWVDAVEGGELVDVVAPARVPEGWRSVLRARDPHGDPVVLAHADQDQLKWMAVLDVVLNNADRKGGHVLHTEAGHVLGVDHGVCLNSDDKLRTVLWGWLGETLPAEAVERLGKLRAQLDGVLAGELAEHITPKEVQAAIERVDRLLADGVFPTPSAQWPAFPWPAL